MTVSTGANVIRSVLSDHLLSWPVDHGKGCCRVCGCTDDHACHGGCAWAIDPHEELGEVGYGLCDLCLDRILVVLETPRQAFASTLAGEIVNNTDNLNLLTLALHCARGDWRRAAIRTRLVEVGD